MTTKQSRTKLLKQLAADVLIAGVILLVFACFHHAVPGLSSGNGGGAIAVLPENTDSSGVQFADFSERFADRFTDGEVEETSNTYRSANVNVSFVQRTVRVDGGSAVCYIFDIYVRSCEYLRTSLYEDTIRGGYHHRIETLTHAQTRDAIAAINGDYCVARDEGVVVRNGTVYRTSPFEDILVLCTDGTMKTYAAGTYSGIDFDSDSIWQVWSFGPSLLSASGEAITRFDSSVSQSNPRSAIGYYEPGHYCIIAVDGRDMGGSEGMTLAELSQLFHDLGCTVAYNLDGGKTSVAVFGDRIINTPYAGGRGCSDIIFVPRED